ncbi:MAG: response regulator [Gammaproteobacteria bacterium]|nr:response regulator [Gammaproteobacteria bacterium]
MEISQKLSYLQAKRSLVAALFLGLVFSTLQISIDLYDQRDEANKTITQVMEIMRKTATQAVYNVNESLAMKVVDGLFQYKPVRVARIIDDELEEVMAERERPKIAGNTPLLAQYVLPNEIFSVPLLFEGREPSIGRLYVEVDNALVAISFLKRTGWVILAGLLRNILLALLLLLIFHATLTRSLLRLINDLAAVDPSQPAEHRVQISSTHQDNELGLLASTVNKLLNSIEESNKNRALAEKARQEANKSRKEAEVVSQEKSVFLANMSHEIRTPMNGILGATQLLSRADLEPKDHRNVELLINSGKILLRIIDDVLDTSKIMAGKMALNEVVFNLHHMMEMIVLSFESVAREKALSFTFRYDQNLPRNIIGDDLRLQQILNNLLGNAFKFTQDGGVTVKVFPSEETGEVKFVVKDDGIGIPPEKQKDLFQPFTQLENTTTRQFGGTGLGLSISRQLAHLMGGDIQVVSSPGEGSTFTLNLPLLDAKDQSIGNSITCQTEIKAPMPDIEILMVEDNAINQRLLHAFLDELKCRTTIAEDGEQALALLREKRFDLVLMDCQLPKMDGFTACRAFRKLEREQAKNSRRTPVIALTAYALSGDRERCLEAGMDDFLTKPVDFDTLQSVIYDLSKSGVENG